MKYRYREQAKAYLWNAFPCRSEPARDGVGTGNTKLADKPQSP
ncbi:hypothetical protein EMIT0347P_60157 [Pseudomonas sp. IT-347P]